MTLFIKLATSAIKKSPFVPLCQREETAQQGNSPSLKREEERGQGRFWILLKKSFFKN